MFYSTRQDWLGSVKGDVLAGAVVALALIPEAIAFSIIAGVDPKVGLYASFCIAVVIAVTGGRPGMISAATGAMALLMVTLVKDHGLQYLLAASVLTGVLQIVFGYCRLGALMRFVSRSVVTGFVNALAILIFMAQLPELTNVSWPVYAMTAAGLVIIYGFPRIPRIGTVLPSPLVCIVVLTLFSLWVPMDVRTVADLGQLPDSLPHFLWPEVPLTLDTLVIIAPYAISMAIVGLLEGLMTATIVDELTDTDSDKNRECRGQGMANIVSGFFGGMAGCAMIGQSVINVKSGGRGRLSTLMAGLILIVMVVFLDAWIGQVPMAALVAIMIMVSIGTFAWESITQIRQYPKSSSMVTFVTVVVVVTTHNLAIGVLIGVLLASLNFASKVGRFLLLSSNRVEQDGTVERTYQVIGQVFFVSAERFVASFDFREAVDRVVIDLSQAHFWDVTAIAALDKVVLKFRRDGATVDLVGLNAASRTLVDRYAVHDKSDVEAILGGH